MAGIVATNVQRYIRNVHAAGGILPKRVPQELQSYDAQACRLRWAQLDHQACGLMQEAARRQASGAELEPAQPPAGTAAARPLMRTGAAETDEADDSDEAEPDLSGVVDANALRRRLMADAGYVLAEPDPPPAAAAPPAPQPGAMQPAMGLFGGGARPPAARAPVPATAPASARGGGGGGAVAAAAAVEPQLNALRQLGEQLSGAESEQLAPLLTPLEGLRQRVETLPTMLHDPGTDMAQKMSEIQALVGEMSALQQRAEQSAAQQVAAGAAAPTNGNGHGNGHGNGNGHGAPRAATNGHGAHGGAPTTIVASGGGGGGDSGLQLGGLDAMDLDGLLQSLESGAAVAGPEEPLVAHTDLGDLD